MILSGAVLMVYNIYAFLRYAQLVRSREGFLEENSVFLYIPIGLLIGFFLGYVGIALFGKPDLLVAGILLGGSIFVFIMHVILNRVTDMVIESEGLKAKLQAAKESDRIKMNFLSSVSHEMRTPLNVILGLNSIVMKNENLSEEGRTHLEKVRHSATHLLGLVNNVLDMNRIETGTLVMKSELFSLRDALGQVNAIAETRCREKGLSYTWVEDEALEGTYLGDETHLRQVLLCILDNAVKYTDAPGSVIFSTEEASYDGTVRTVRFIVEDTGIGIDKEFLPKLFEAFSQEDSSTTNRYGGSGLSLSLSRSLVHQMGGTIEVQSEKGKGSVFTVTVPLEVSHIQETTASDVSLAGKRILIVEDLPENAEIVQDLLELEDVETEHAENGKIALEYFTSHPEHYYDAILMDLRMPVMDGLECTKKIRALDRADARTIPIIALTANSFQKDIDDALEAGMNAHLAKPADAELLYETIRRML